MKIEKTTTFMQTYAMLMVLLFWPILCESGNAGSNNQAGLISKAEANIMFQKYIGIESYNLHCKLMNTHDKLNHPELPFISKLLSQKAMYEITVDSIYVQTDHTVNGCFRTFKAYLDAQTGQLLYVESTNEALGCNIDRVSPTADKLDSILVRRKYEFTGLPDTSVAMVCDLKGAVQKGIISIAHSRTIYALFLNYKYGDTEYSNNWLIIHKGSNINISRHSDVTYSEYWVWYSSDPERGCLFRYVATPPY